MAGEKDDDGVAAITAVIAALKPLEPKTRTNVLEFVLKQLDIDLVPAADAEDPKPKPNTLFETPPPPPPGDQVDIRTLGKQKQPNTLNEKVALVAYYIRNVASAAERRDYITSADIEKYFVEAGFALPVGPPNMALTNAKNAGYLNAVGSGQYRLNAVGHNLVAHRLPSADAPKANKAKSKAVKKKRR